MIIDNGLLEGALSRYTRNHDLDRRLRITSKNKAASAAFYFSTGFVCGRD